MKFQVISEYKPTGDQPQAIEKLAKGIVDGDKYVAVVALDGRARERVGVTCNSLD